MVLGWDADEPAVEVPVLAANKGAAGGWPAGVVDGKEKPPDGLGAGVVEPKRLGAVVLVVPGVPGDCDCPPLMVVPKENFGGSLVLLPVDAAPKALLLVDPNRFPEAAVLELLPNKVLVPVGPDPNKPVPLLPPPKIGFFVVSSPLIVTEWIGFGM